MEVYCVLENGDYGTWYKAPLEYDAIYKNKQRAISHAKEYTHGAVHILKYTNDKWICDTKYYYNHTDKNKRIIQGEV